MAIIDDYAAIAAELRRKQAEKRPGKIPAHQASQRSTVCESRFPASNCTDGLLRRSVMARSSRAGDKTPAEAGARFRAFWSQ